MAKKGKKRAWFKHLRGSYIPVNYKGALTYIPFVAYLLVSILIPFHYIDSKAVATFVVIPNWLLAAVIMTSFAKSHAS